MNMKLKKGCYRLGIYLSMLLFLMFLLFPFYWMFVTSIKPESELFSAVVRYWPSKPTGEAYSKLFQIYDFWSPLKNSLLVAVSTTVLSIFVAVLAAYAFSRYEFPGRKYLMILFLTNNMFPTVLLLIPLYAIMRSISLLYTPWALILSYTTFTIPFSIWLMNGYMNDLPMEMEEAAMVDGCNRAQAFVKVELPMLIPGIIACGVYIFMNAWNEYTFAVMFTNEKNRTIAVSLKNLTGQLGTQWDLMTAGGLIAVLPICIMFFFAQKRLIAGMTAGAVKG